MTEEAKVPGFFRRRELLDSDRTSEGNLSSQAEAFEEEGLLDEALSFHLRAGNEKGIERILEKSRKTGDFFTFDAALKALGRTSSREEWKKVGEVALASGRLWFAYRSFEKADDQEGLEKVREEMERQGVSLPS